MWRGDLRSQSQMGNGSAPPNSWQGATPGPRSRRKQPPHGAPLWGRWPPSAMKRLYERQRCQGLPSAPGREHDRRGPVLGRVRGCRWARTAGINSLTAGHARVFPCGHRGTGQGSIDHGGDGMSIDAEIMAISEQMDPDRLQELLDYQEQLIEQQRANN